MGGSWSPRMRSHRRTGERLSIMQSITDDDLHAEISVLLVW